MLGHTINTQSQSSSTYYIETNREAASSRGQGNMVQMKEEIKTPEKELNKMEISKLSDAEYKTGYKVAPGI